MANTLEQQRIQLYKATPLKLQLVDELASLIKNCFPNVETNGIRFDDSHLRLEGLTVKMLEIDPQEIGGVLIHWYPKFDISNTSDPFCSAYMLTINELKKLIKTLQNVKNSYQLHNKM
jgi:hypothetical protein